VWTAQSCCSGKSTFIRAEFGGTDLAENLSFGTIVFVKVRLWSIASRTFTVIIDITLRASGNRLNLLTITPFDVWNVIPVIPWVVVKNLREFINLEFLVLRRMRIIINPLLEWNVSADKVKKIANNSLLVLN
jgi:hypothetical protein